MGRQRLIVQADLTSEEDQAFLAWVKAKLRRRRLAEEIRAGLRLQYEKSTGQGALEYASYQQPPTMPEPKARSMNQDGGNDDPASGTSGRLQRLVKSF